MLAVRTQTIARELRVPARVAAGAMPRNKGKRTADEEAYDVSKETLDAAYAAIGRDKPRKTDHWRVVGGRKKGKYTLKYDLFSSQKARSTAHGYKPKKIRKLKDGSPNEWDTVEEADAAAVRYIAVVEAPDGRGRRSKTVEQEMPPTKRRRTAAVEERCSRYANNGIGMSVDEVLDKESERLGLWAAARKALASLVRRKPKNGDQDVRESRQTRPPLNVIPLSDGDAVARHARDERAAKRSKKPLGVNDIVSLFYTLKDARRMGEAARAGRYVGSVKRVRDDGGFLVRGGAAPKAPSKHTASSTRVEGPPPACAPPRIERNRRRRAFPRYGTTKPAARSATRRSGSRPARPGISRSSRRATTIVAGPRW